MNPAVAWLRRRLGMEEEVEKHWAHIADLEERGKTSTTEKDKALKEHKALMKSLKDLKKILQSQHQHQGGVL